MKKLVFLALMLSISAFAQSPTITWTRVYQAPAADGGGFGNFFNAYHDIRYDGFSKGVWIYSTDQNTGGNTIYSIRLHYFLPGTNQDFVIGDNRQQTSLGCVNSSATWPYSHHAVGQMWVSPTSHKLWMMEGTRGANIAPEQWYFPLTASPSQTCPTGDSGQAGCTWIETQPTHLPMTTARASVAGTAQSTTLTGGGAGVGTPLLSSDTQMYVAHPAVLNSIFTGANNDIQYVSLPAAAGNQVQIQYINPAGSSASLSVTSAQVAAVWTITVNLAKSGGVVTTVASDVVTAINTTSPANTLVSASLCSIASTPINTCDVPNDGTGLVAALSLASLNGFATGDFIHLDSGEVIRVTADGGQHCAFGTVAANPLSIARNQYGTTASASLAIGSAVWEVQGLHNGGDVAYDQDDDVGILLGSPFGPGPKVGMALYADTNGTGILSAAQIAAGAVNADDWTDVTAWSSCTDAACAPNAFQTPNVACATATVSCNGKLPPGYYYPNIDYDTVNHWLVQAGGAAGNSGAPRNAVFTAKRNGKVWVWTNQNPTCVGADCQAGIPQASAPHFVGVTAEAIRVAHKIVAGKYYYHSSNNTGTAIPSQDWVWTPSPSTWTELQTNAMTAAPAWLDSMTHDPVSNCLIAWGASGNPQPSLGEIWKGCFGAALPTLSVPITVQEALFPGDMTGTTDATPGGFARTNEAFCQGVPIADSAALTSTSSLALTGATAGQFRLLGTWPDSNYKWIEVCGVVPAVAAGSTATVTLTNGGTGNFGGPNMAQDNTPDANHITITTGAGVFTVKKANFNVIDTAVIGATTVVSTHSTATDGLTLMGPVAPATSCPSLGTCVTPYSSSNDAASTSVIEKNGPVEAVIMTNGTFKDAGNHPYEHFTVRQYFRLGSAGVKTTVIERNADYDNVNTPSLDCAYAGGSCQGGTFNVSTKGKESLEIRIPMAVSAPITYTFATATTPLTGTVSTEAHIYSAQLQYLNPNGNTPGLQDFVGNAVCGGTTPGTCGYVFTPDLGWAITNNGSPLANSPLVTAPPTQGWADCSNASGTGIEIGVYQMAAYWPKSLECNGTEVRIGILPVWNTNPSYIAWTKWDITDTFIEFHATAPASLSNDFLKWQHKLVARVSDFNYYNTTGVFYGHTILGPAAETAYYRGLSVSSSPPIGITKFLYQCPLGCRATGTDEVVPDRGMTIGTYPLAVFRWYNWPTGGAGNQEDFRFSDLLRFLQNGQTGRLLSSMHFYRMLAQNAWPHSDGTLANGTDATVNHFQWQNRPHAYTAQPELEGSGYPSISAGCQGDGPPAAHACAKLPNSVNSFVAWGDPLHAHQYSIVEGYYLTGDETLHDAIYAKKAWFLNPDTYQGGQQGNAPTRDQCGTGAFCYTRSFGIALMWSARLSTLLFSTGDPDAAAVRAAGAYIWTTWVKPDVCVPGSGNTWPFGCTLPPLTYATPLAVSPPDPSGVSRVRGLHLTSARGDGWCPQHFDLRGFRIAQDFQHSILEKGLGEFRTVSGPAAATNWTATDYNFAGDLMVGLGRGALFELYNDDGTANWQSLSGNALYNGGRYNIVVDQANQCTTALNQLPTTGYVTTNGLIVTWSSGQNFAGSLAGDVIGINGTPFTIGTVNSTTQLALATVASASAGNPGLNTTPVPWMRHTVQPVAIQGNWPIANGNVNIVTATATATVSGGQVTGGTVTFGASGYAGNVPIIVGGPGSGATAVGIVTGGVVTSISVTAPGSGYSSASFFLASSASWVSAQQFPTDGSWNGLQIGFNNISSGVSSTTATNMTLTGQLPNETNIGYSINPEVFQVGLNAYDARTLAQPGQGIWDNFSAIGKTTGFTDWARKFNVRMQQLAFHFSDPDDFGSVDIMDAIAAAVNTGNVLQDVPFVFADQGGGTYLLTFTPPAAAASLRIKYSPVAAQAIQADTTQLLNFDNLVTQNFGIPPATNLPWFGANPIAEPAVTPGVSQSVTVVTGITGLTKPNFSVKVMAPVMVSSGTTLSNATCTNCTINPH